MTFFELPLAQLAMYGFGGLLAILVALASFLGRMILKRMDQLHVDNLESRRENREAHRESRRENREDHRENSRKLEAIHTKIDENQKAVYAKIDENQKAVHAKIDENQKAVYAKIDEDRQQNQARFEELATMFKHLDGKVSAMVDLLVALVTGKEIPEALTGQRKAGPAE